MTERHFCEYHEPHRIDECPLCLLDDMEMFESRLLDKLHFALGRVQELEKQLKEARDES